MVTLGTEFLFPDGDLFGDIAFSQRVVPIGQVPSGGSAETGGHHQALRASLRLRFSRNQGRIGNHWRSIGAVRIYRLQRNSSTDSRASARACQLRSTRSCLCYCNFWQSHPAILRGRYRRQNLRQMEKSHLHDGINTGRRPHSRAIFAALIT